MTDEECDAYILDDVNLNHINLLGILNVSPRRVQVIGANGVPNGNYANFGNRPVENFYQWEPITKPLSHLKAMEVLSYVNNILLTGKKLPPVKAR
jgi:hypothetical protein